MRCLYFVMVQTALMILKLKDQVDQRLCPLKSTVLLDVFSEIVDDSSEDHFGTAGEVDRYLSVSIIDFKTGDPYLWWS